MKNLGIFDKSHQRDRSLGGQQVLSGHIICSVHWFPNWPPVPAVPPDISWHLAGLVSPLLGGGDAEVCWLNVLFNEHGGLWRGFQDISIRGAIKLTSSSCFSCWHLARLVSPLLGGGDAEVCWLNNGGLWRGFQDKGSHQIDLLFLLLLLISPPPPPAPPVDILQD